MPPWRTDVTRLLAAAALAASLLGLAACGGASGPPTPARSYVFAFAGADDLKGRGSDFLAVIDADPASPGYGRVVATAPIHALGTMPHHMELTMPPSGRWLFANGFMSGRTFLFDLSDPLAPKLAATIDSVPGFRKPHSFARLADGNVLATLQYGDGEAAGDPGGLVLFSPRGEVLKTATAADVTFPHAPIRSYSLDVAPGADRVLTTSSPMDDVPAAPVLQLWRLSDLARLRTMAMPTFPGETKPQQAFEARFLPGDSLALVNSWTCGVYLASGLRGTTPKVEPLFQLPRPRSDWCAVPLLVGRFWILPVGAAHEYQVYDVADPRHPRRVSTLAVDSTYWPHWLAREPGTDRVVLTSDTADHRVLIARFDSVAGVLRIDSTFRDPGSPRAGVDFDRRSWPHGEFGAALPHGAIFSTRQAARAAR